MYELKNELTSKKYVEVTDLELEYPPESVLIYLRNNTEQDIRMSIEFLDINIQTPLINQNPTLVIEDSGEATVCLSPADESYETLICDGAVNFVDIHEYVNIMDGDIINVTGSVLKINGTITQNLPEYISSSPLEEPSLQAPPGYRWSNSTRVFNTSPSDVKIEVISEPVNQNQYINILENNPTSIVEPVNGRIGFCLSAGEEVPISCDGAVSSFAAKTSFETNQIEIQIDDGLWTDIYTTNPFVSVRFQPGNPGADLVVELTDNNSHTVRLRTTRDIGLYVNPLTGFDQINNNKAYKIYSRNGDLIDPHNTELYDYTGREFDDTSTNEDYAIFFAQAEFCLAPVIEDSCDGATNSTGCIQLEGTWDLEINGEIVLIDATPEQIEEYAGTLRGSLALAERCCDMGYFRSISLQTVLHNVQNGDTVYVPVALSPDGPSITSPIIIAADNNDWYSIGRNYSLQLDAQLRPYGLTSDWTNNFKEFGVTYYNVQQTKNEVKKFYILEEGNTVSPLMLPRGLPPLECFFPS